jgi:murein L,D-transpeptidase YafK
MSWVILLLLAILIPGAEAQAQHSRDRVMRLQRMLGNGCDEWVTRDGIWGPETEAAYQRCRKKGDLPEDIDAFMEELWHRKLALILLHQLDYLPVKYDLGDRNMLTDALRQVSIDRGIKPILMLRPADINRLYQWYIQNPPEGSLGRALRDKGMPFTGLEIYIQVFKKEEEVHVFAREGGEDSPFARLKILPVARSPFTYPPNGDPERAGPKTVRGDCKVPEGCYRITWQNKWSTFYLGYLLSYPHDGDRIRRNYWEAGSRSGGAIVLHGSDATIGCIPIGDAGIEELFLLLNKNWSAHYGHGTIHIFPCRFGVPKNERILRRYGNARRELVPFWESLRPIYRYFEQNRLIPLVRFDESTGYYQLEGS